MCFLGLLPGTGCLLSQSSILLRWTLAPNDYVIYYQARGLSGHTSPRDECAGFFLEDYVLIEED